MRLKYMELKVREGTTCCLCDKLAEYGHVNGNKSVSPVCRRHFNLARFMENVNPDFCLQWNEDKWR